VDFEMQVCKLYLLFTSADAAQEKKEKKVLQPTGVSKPVTHAVHLTPFCNSKATPHPLPPSLHYVIYEQSQSGRTQVPKIIV
jgi:hypothetical protein